ncbi:hypothetical protein ElyMa_005312900 [Elysia marginata]|uniref:Uncharacterized protein n=1 Tax=Elysia marginata TaxID=1093978 RepID=A0AAV4JYW4_9GAST|nr:hypothetical protein ElyMa_005312900 [Elysia marginata]
MQQAVAAVINNFFAIINESVRELVVAYVGPQEPLLATVKRRKLAWFGHVTRHDISRRFSRAQWKASADEDDKGRLGVITSRNGPEWQCMNWSGQPQTEMHGDTKLILLPSDPPDDPTGRGTE